MEFLKDLKNKNLSDEICLLRIDLNIENKELENWEKDHKNVPFRIKTILPTIKFLIHKKVKVVILSHRGRPIKKSKIKNQKSKLQLKIQNYKNFSLKPFSKILSKLLDKKINFINFLYPSELFFQRALTTINNSPAGSIFLLENLRFFEDEEKNDKNFAKKLASLGTFYVNDAFAVSHRKNASVAAITNYLPSYAGFQLEKEIKNLNMALQNPNRPLMIIIGGAKISDKLGLINNFLKKVDCFLIGGGIANTFIAAQGLKIGDSLYEKEMIPEAKKILGRAPKKIFLPIDFVVENKKILDIGPKTINFYSKKIKSAKTIIWNGPMGKFEDKKFTKGTKKIAEALLKNKKKAKIIIGGGETISAIFNFQFSILNNKRVFLSTGGGAMLEFLSGKKLPGIEALK